ncbi:MAG: lysophospholipid acyltransferase family protein [Gemmatimonadales bacterium]
MSEVMRAVASAWTWLWMGVVLLVGLPILALLVLVTAPFDRGRYVAGRWFRLVGVAMAKVNPLWRFRWSGSSPPDPRRPYVVVSNHESFADILLISHLPWEMKWMAKAEMFRLPVVGWMMRLAGDIPIERGVGGRALAQALAKSRATLAERVSVMMFPEGTRSTTAEMLPFKDGAFLLAIEAGVPILPLAVSGTRTALAKHDWRFHRAVAEVAILEPVETSGLGPGDAEALKQHVRAMILRAREGLRARLAK